MKSLSLLTFASTVAAALAGPAAQAGVTLDCGSFMQDEITIQLEAAQATVTAPDIIYGRTRVLAFKGDDGTTATFSGDKNTAKTGKPFYSSLVLKVPSSVAKMSVGSKVELALIERYSDNLADPGVPLDWKPKCVVR